MANTTNFGWETPDNTDLVKDGALAIRTLGSAIDTSLVDLKGGTSGQVLSKATNTDMDFTWVTQDDANAIQNAIVDAKGDLITATAADVPARLAVGTDGQVLTADSSTATGLKWAAVSSKILQTITTTKLDTFTSNSTTAVDVTGLSVTITPSSTSSTILVFAIVNGNGQAGSNGVMFRLLRGSTNLIVPTSSGSRSAGFGSIYLNDAAQVSSTSISYVDSPATTSATTYKIQGFATSAGNFYVNRSQSDTDSSAFVRTASSITVIEIGA
jgi:hypothetical protein